MRRDVLLRLAHAAVMAGVLSLFAGCTSAPPPAHDSSGRFNEQARLAIVSALLLKGDMDVPLIQGDQQYEKEDERSEAALRSFCKLIAELPNPPNVEARYLRLRLWALAEVAEGLRLSRLHEMAALGEGKVSGDEMRLRREHDARYGRALDMLAAAERIALGTSAVGDRELVASQVSFDDYFVVPWGAATETIDFVGPRKYAALKETEAREQLRMFAGKDTAASFFGP